MNGDSIFRWITALAGLSVVVLIVLMIKVLLISSHPSLPRFGLSFLWGQVWDPAGGKFGALPLIWGTLVTSALALLIAVPVSLGVALALTQLVPRPLASPLSFLVELLAAVPSVVYGLWGLFVLAPFLGSSLYPLIASTLGSFLPFLAPPVIPFSVMTGGIILAIMILPTISAISKDLFAAVPNTQKEAIISLGATKWEVAKLVMSYSRSGLIGAIMLGLARAVGETMAVTMVIGNRFQIPSSLFQAGYTMASIIANEFTEAISDLHLSALMEVGLVLFLIALLINIMARLFVWRSLRAVRGAVRE